MRLGTLLKSGAIVAGALLFAACAKNQGGLFGDGLSAHGLGDNLGFLGQEAGEMFTTKAPHNQIYLFAYDDSSLAEKYVDSVHAQAEYLKSHPHARILLTGNTDERGSREYNVALGERRANTVADILRMDGVSRKQMRVVSYGKERPAYLGHDQASHAQNRRDELTYEATQ